ncbi:hypothetical protein SI65_03284 [Aspergillus cristatus]|uniref:Uncharacterized protein n=1 Tax=Aspergillus cristatus TaxID=573508 RepID=A0A1E3BHF8_ASPCR|nr:hypothetical protein SI65_03284 [Aspergillus cristatus]
MSGGLVKKLLDPLQWSSQLPRGPCTRRHGYHRSQGWRPISLRPLYLLFVAVLMFVMFLAIEILRRYSEWNGGLIYFKDTASVSHIQSFAYNYVPIIVALVLVTFWSFVEFDVLRLEPYFQLSRPEGAPATVLFINYNFGQSVITPITSARRGHWVVLCVSLFTMLMRMSLPALHSTLFELREVTLLSDETMHGWPNLVDLHTQATWMASQATNNFDSVVSSNDDLQRSRSTKYAVAPVEIPGVDQRESTVWTMNQTIYWAEPICQDVVVNEKVSVVVDGSQEDPTVSWNVTGVPLVKDGATIHDCKLDFNYSSVLFAMTDKLQVRYWEPVSANTSLSSNVATKKAFTARGCDPFDLYGVLLGVNASSDAVSAPTQYTSSASIFACDIKYNKAEAEVSMHANSSITSITIHNGTTRELTPQQFNVPDFQDLLSERAPYTSDLLYIRINETSGDTTVTELPVISQQLGDMEPVLILDTSSVMSPEEFESKVVRGVKQTFVLTMGRLFNPDEKPTIIHATRLSNQVAIATVGFAAFWSEVVLAAGTVISLLLVYIYHRRPNIMQSDPGPISAMCSMVADVFSPSNILTDSRYDLHQFSTRQLRRILRNSRIHWQDGPTGKRLEIRPSEDDASLVENLGENLQARVDPMPHFLLIPVFILEFLLLTAVIASMALIIGLLARNGKFRHLTQSDSSFLQVVLSVLPSIVASAVGSLCTSIHRNLSILEPWVHLQRGMAAARTSLSMNYSAQNPWAVLYKAARDRHLLLGLVSVACVVNTVLTVVAGGLFTQQLATSYLPTDQLLTNYSETTFWRTDFAADFTEYDLIQSSITSGVPMVAWTSTNHSFVPIKIENPDPNAVYSAHTLGVGADLDCQKLEISENLVDNHEEGRVYWEYNPFDSPERRCKVDMTSLKNTTSGISLSIHFLSPVAVDETDLCQTSTVVVLGRWNYEPGAPVTDHNTVALHCEPRMEMEKYSIFFDQKGQIEEYHPINSTAITSGEMYDNATASVGQFNKVFAAIPQSYTGNSSTGNGSYIASYDWAGFLVARLYQQQEVNMTRLNAAHLIEVSRTVYQWVYSTYFSIWREIYLQPLQDPYPAKNSTVIYSMWAMDPSVPSLAIALMIIAFDTLVVLVVFGTRRGRFKGPRIPRSIGAVIPWLAHSRMLNDFPGTYTWTNTDRRAHLERLNKRYAFRTFLSPDGRWRFAVDEEQDVPPPPPQPPEGEWDLSKAGDIQLRELGREPPGREPPSPGTPTPNEHGHI